MNLPPELLQFFVSLLAIFALAGLAWWMKLGGESKITSETEASNAANEAIDGYAPSAISLDAKGAGAVMRDAGGQILVLKRHGNKFAGRILTSAASATANGRTIEINSGERRYGKVALTIPDAEIWAVSINKIGAEDDA